MTFLRYGEITRAGAALVALMIADLCSADASPKETRAMKRATR